MKATFPALATVVGVAVAIFTLAASPAGAAAHRDPLVLPHDKHHTAMHWYRGHSSARQSVSQARRYGSTAVVGLESMRDLTSLRDRYGCTRSRLSGRRS
jgi:hypothetical protein